MRRHGIGAIQRKHQSDAKFKEKGNELASVQLHKLSVELEKFRQHLEEFAVKHRNEIKKNPKFRSDFQKMCASIGVDPLASSKGFFAEALGVGDFYYELAVQIVEVCLATKDLYGGIMTLDELKNRLVRSRSKTRKDTIETEDLVRAIGKLKILGNGFSLIPLPNNRMLVQSVPGELNKDDAKVLSLAQNTASVTISQLSQSYQWDKERSERIMAMMVTNGLVWVDNQADEITFWFPGLFGHL